MGWVSALGVIAAEGGYGLMREDWFARIPVALAVLALVIIVDAIVFTRTIRALRRRAA